MLYEPAFLILISYISIPYEGVKPFFEINFPKN